MPDYRIIEYMCSHCGKKERKLVNTGRPAPGKCPRKSGDRPHVWLVNRKIK